VLKVSFQPRNITHVIEVGQVNPSCLQGLSASLMALRQVSQRHGLTRVFEVGQVNT
jgi:hypothetical protein